MLLVGLFGREIRESERVARMPIRSCEEDGEDMEFKLRELIGDFDEDDGSSAEDDELEGKLEQESEQDKDGGLFSGEEVKREN